MLMCEAKDADRAAVLGGSISCKQGALALKTISAATIPNSENIPFVSCYITETWIFAMKTTELSRPLEKGLLKNTWSTHITQGRKFGGFSRNKLMHQEACHFFSGSPARWNLQDLFGWWVGCAGVSLETDPSNPRNMWWRSSHYVPQGAGSHMFKPSMACFNPLVHVACFFHGT